MTKLRFDYFENVTKAIIAITKVIVSVLLYPCFFIAWAAKSLSVFIFIFFLIVIKSLFILCLGTNYASKNSDQG